MNDWRKRKKSDKKNEREMGTKKMIGKMIMKSKNKKQKKMMEKKGKV